MLLLDPEGVIARANAAAEQFLNHSQSTLAERGWRGLLPDDSPVLALLAEARAGDAGIAAYDLPVEFIGGRRVQADLLVSTLPEHEGWLLLSFQPRSMTSLMERQLGQQGAVRSAAGVAAMLAHEIRNPLSGIRGAAQLLAAELDGEGRELTDLIIAEVERVRLLIDRMDAFTDTPRPFAPENIHAILSHVRRVAETGFASTLLLKERYDPSLPPVRGDRDRLVQAFLNLVKNAAEASPPGGTITITTAFRQGVRMRRASGAGRLSLPLEVCVIDEGEGPPAHIVNHLFDPFVSARRGGTGLGLPLVAKVIDDHGGIVEYERRDGRTIFHVLLPLAEDS